MSIVGLGLLAGCANELRPHQNLIGDASVQDGSAAEGGIGNSHMLDAAALLDAMPIVDAFFINDPAPPMCLADGAVIEAENPGGTPTCPDDKNREGCPCPEANATAACWPGKRVNRGHGVCKDGVAKCVATDEFGLRWGKCEGYVLPTPGAVAGPEACSCFSSGMWNVANLVPCIDQHATETFLYSSKPEANGTFSCGSVTATPPTAPADAWSGSTLKVDCAGKFTLCFTIKAGLVSAPKGDDCVITKQCVDVDYQQEGATQTLPSFPGWASSDGACGKRFIDIGGYGEMTVQGKSVECDVIDDGTGQPYVFRRSGYCPPRCRSTPDAAECQACATGGSGAFGN